MARKIEKCASADLCQIRLSPAFIARVEPPFGGPPNVLGGFPEHLESCAGVGCRSSVYPMIKRDR